MCHVYMRLPRVGSSGTGLIAVCELLHTDAGNLTLAFCRSITSFAFVQTMFLCVFLLAFLLLILYLKKPGLS